MRAIVVDDEPKIRNGLCRLVEGLEEWTVARSFEEAAAAMEYLKRCVEETALELIDKISDVKEMEVTNDKQREERYKEALKTCDCRVWISMIKALYLRRKDRLEQGKKMTDLDERYFKTAEDNLYSELALSLGMKKDEMVSYITERVLAEA